MPTYVVKRTTPVLASVTVEAASEDEARWFAQCVWVTDAKHAAILSEPALQPGSVPTTPATSAAKHATNTRTTTRGTTRCASTDGV